MPKPHRLARPRRAAWILSLVALLVLVTAFGVLRSPVRARAAATRVHTMTDAQMKRMVAAWYASHPIHGTSAAASAADTFTVQNFIFDTDGSLGTQIDTARIVVGQSVMIRWLSGFHTCTSGQPGEPTAGSHFDHPVDSGAGNMEFSIPFDTVGTYPFHCQPHGQFFDMKGVVVVGSNPVSVPPRPQEAGKSGFVAAPWPNPTRAGASFRFALPNPGRARVLVFDASGRAVANVLDRDLPAGTYAGVWDGRERGGSAVRAGVYYLRLEGPSVRSSRSIVVER